MAYPPGGYGYPPQGGYVQETVNVTPYGVQETVVAQTPGYGQPSETVIVEEGRRHHRDETVIVENAPNPYGPGQETVVIEEKRHHHRW